MTIRLSVFLIVWALFACSGYRQWTDSWCECMWAADSTAFTR